MTSNPSHRLNIKDKLNQESVQRYLQRIDWAGSSPYPFVVELDPTTQCNLACPDCISGSLLNQGYIDRIRIRTLVHEMIDAGVRAVILIGGGEPMMHAETRWIIETFGQAGVRLGITTNGLYLKKHLDVTARYADWVRVSMDAGSAETFGRIRPSRTGNSLFDAAIDNMSAYAKVKRGALGYSFMVFRSGDYGFSESQRGRGENGPSLGSYQTNAHEIALAARIARDIGCDYFEVKPMYDVNHFAVLQSPEIADIVEEQIDLARRLETDRFKVIEAVKLRATLRGESSLEPKEYQRCAVAQVRTLVTPSGVYVCPYFRGVPSKKVGDIADTSFLDMWHGSRRAEVMSRLNPSIDCPMHCIRHESNLAIESMLKTEFPEPTRDHDLFI